VKIWIAVSIDLGNFFFLRLVFFFSDQFPVFSFGSKYLFDPNEVNLTFETVSEFFVLFQLLIVCLLTDFQLSISERYLKRESVIICKLGIIRRVALY
jgi:hypothetical protein